VTEIAILVPVLARPGNAARLVASITENTKVPYRILFLCSPGDDAEIEAAQETGAEVRVVSFRCGPGDYAAKINHGFHATDEPWIFQGADDLRFHRGWDEKVLRVGESSKAGVVGTNDLGNPRVRRGLLSTHSLVRRSYVVEQGGSLDGPGVVLHEGYHHNFVDAELVELASVRRAWTFAKIAIVEHLHPHWGKGQMDATYDLGLSTYREDQRLFGQRMKLIRSQRARQRRRIYG
jgi:glycosyltransferase involved in cell wall biosynthesis